MSYEGRHRLDRGDLGDGLRVAKVAGLAGAAATTAVLLSVGFGAGTAQAWPGFGGGGGSTTTNTTTAPTTKTPFGHFIIKQNNGPAPSNYFTFGKTGTAITGICFNPAGC
jgi:hypothetical protein